MGTRRPNARSAVLAITLLFVVAVPTAAAPAGAAGRSALGASAAHATSRSGRQLAADIATKKPKRPKKKRKAKGLTARLEHDGVVLIVLAALAYALFLIGSGVRGPRGRKRQRARATARRSA